MALQRTWRIWKAQSSSVMLQVAAGRPGFTFVPVKKTYDVIILGSALHCYCFIPSKCWFCHHCCVCWRTHTFNLIHMQADAHGRLLSPLKLCTKTEKTRALTNFDKDLMIKQPCWLNTSTNHMTNPEHLRQRPSKSKVKSQFVSFAAFFTPFFLIGP